MKINDFYRDAAKVSLNDSIAVLIPSLILAASNIAVFKNPDIMKLTIPFFLYSFICFQIYLFQMKRSIQISKNIRKNRDQKKEARSIFDARQLLVLYQNCQSPKLQFFFPDGILAATMKKFPQKGCIKWRLPKTYALYNQHEVVIGLYQLQGKRIKVYDQSMSYLGSFEKNKLRRKGELVDKESKRIGSVEGAAMFMDELVLNQNQCEVARLRRGWMPMEWSELFPEANTPVLSMHEGLPENDKLLGLAILIQVYFVER